MEEEELEIQNNYFFRTTIFFRQKAPLVCSLLECFNTACPTFATWYSICVTAYTAFNLIWVEVVSPVYNG